MNDIPPPVADTHATTEELTSEQAADELKRMGVDPNCAAPMALRHNQERDPKMIAFVDRVNMLKRAIHRRIFGGNTTRD